MSAANHVFLPISLALLMVHGSLSITMTSVISTSNGPVQGFLLGNASVFLGIPFAAPPVGKLRFMPPVAPTNWTITLSATSFGPVCMQAVRSGAMSDADISSESRMGNVLTSMFSLSSGSTQMSEDCLYLNVLSPNITSTKKYPVMFFIHGGGYTTGSAAQFIPDTIINNLVSRGVVVVTTNYRLNVFGFFSTRSSVVPGNQGLRDQIAALKWVNSEISKFGGDPKQITIFGESAGSASVSLLTLSPMAQNLFSKAIMESGTAFCPWAFDGNAYYYSPSSQITAVAAKCTTANLWSNGQINSQMLTCLQNISAVQLFMTMVNATNARWVPVQDGPNGVLPDWPINLARKRPNSMPLLIGTNHDEFGDFLIGMLHSESPLWVNNFTQSLYDNAVNQLIPKSTYGSKQSAVYYAVETAYIATPPAANDHMGWLKTTVQMESGFSFFSGARKDIDLALQYGNPNVYVYSFDYVSNSMPHLQNYTGVGHVFELFYLFKGLWQYWVPPTYPWKYDSNDTAIANQMGLTWTTFAKSGNLTSLGMLPVSQANPTQYYSINLPSTMMQYYHTISSNLWNKVVPAIMGGGPNQLTTQAPTTQAPLSTTTRGSSTSGGASLSVSCSALISLILLMIKHAMIS